MDAPLPRQGLKQIGERVRALREAHGLTLSALDRLTGLPVGYTRKIEYAIQDPSATRIARYADPLGTTLDWLLLGRRTDRS